MAKLKTVMPGVVLRYGARGKTMRFSCMIGRSRFTYTVKTPVELLLNKNDFRLRGSYEKMQPTRKKYRLKCFHLNNMGRLFPSQWYSVEHPIKSEGSALLSKLGFDGEFIFFPGHTEGMTAIKCGDVLYCGDAFTALFYEAEIPPYATDIAEMKKSLEKLAKTDVRWLACGHGLPVKMSDARKVIANYLKNA